MGMADAKGAHGIEEAGKCFFGAGARRRVARAVVARAGRRLAQRAVRMADD